LYNRYLVEQLRGAGMAVSYHASTAEIDRADERDFVIVDSLALSGAAPQLLTLRARLVLLLHVVPASFSRRGR
jgi:hypothetical protein